LCRLTARLEEEAAVVVRALEPRAKIGFGTHLVPRLRTRRSCEIGQTAVARALGPVTEPGYFVRDSRLQQCLSARARLIQTQKAQIVAPTLEQREAHLLVVERLLQEGEVLPYELLLQV